MRCGTILVLPNGCKVWESGHCHCPDCKEARQEGKPEAWQLWLEENGPRNALEVQRKLKKKESIKMTGEPLIRWLYMHPGDMLEYKDRNGNIKRIGPIVKIDERPNQVDYPIPERRRVLVSSFREPAKLVDVPLERVQAVFRNDQEIIRFTEDERQKFGCMAVCSQRETNYDIPGKVFCSLACQLEWIERYYQDYAPGTNPIDRGEVIHTANCGECRKLNRGYCPNCVD